MKKKILLMISIFFLCINHIYARETVKFYKCVDGDTIEVTLNDKNYTVRLLAIDTPESVKPNTKVEYYGKESSDYTCKKIKNAKKLELEYDEKSDKFDKYNRMLAWVFVDDKLLQTELVEHGYAKVAYLYNDYKYTDILQEKQELASAKSIGIWNSEEKAKFENSDTVEETENAENTEIVFLVILFMIITYFTNLFSKFKKKK